MHCLETRRERRGEYSEHAQRTEAHTPGDGERKGWVWRTWTKDKSMHFLEMRRERGGEYGEHG